MHIPPLILLSALPFLLLSAASPNRTCTYPSSSSIRTPVSSFIRPSPHAPLFYCNSRPALSENRLSVVQRAHPGLQSSSLRVGMGFFAFSEICICVELAGRSLFVCLHCISSVPWRGIAITRIVGCLNAFIHRQKYGWWLRSVCCVGLVLRSVCCVGLVPVWASWVANSLVCCAE